MKQDVSEDLLIRYVLGEASEAEMTAVAIWINASGENTRRFEQTKFILETSSKLAKESPVTETDAWETFKERRNLKPAPVRSIVRFNPWLRVAASIILVTGAAWVSYHFLSSRDKATQMLTITAHDRVITDTLPDGSIVHLNKMSSITYNSDFKSGRVISLTGEAFFDVVHNVKKPFKVQAGNVMISDIGTSFNISSDKKRVEIIVESGIVAVRLKKEKIELAKQEMIIIQSGEKFLRKQPVKDLLYNYYRTNTFVADHTPLYKLVDALNKAYSANIIIKGNRIAETTITGTFPARNSLDQILSVILTTTPEIHITKTKGSITLQ
jgi:transmembrane sensor